MKTSNKFTLLRVILAPVIFFVYSFPVIFKFPKDSIVSIVSIVASILLLIFAELTDYFDGYYARKHEEVSDFGKLFDVHGRLQVRDFPEVMINHSCRDIE